MCVCGIGMVGTCWVSASDLNKQENVERNFVFNIMFYFLSLNPVCFYILCASDIVGQDWVGWQDDTLAKADVVVHLCGGFTEQRVMACERLVRESLRVNDSAMHVTVNPLLEDIAKLSPGLVSLKNERLIKCEKMVKEYIANAACLRLEASRFEKACDEIQNAITKFAIY